MPQGSAVPSEGAKEPASAEQDEENGTECTGEENIPELRRKLKETESKCMPVHHGTCCAEFYCPETPASRRK